MREVVVVDALRTPIGRWGGALATVRPDDLAAFVMRALVARTKVDPERIDDVFWGAANQAGEDNRDVARMAALLAGLPIGVPGTTVQRLCGSGLQAVNSAAQAIASGCGEIMLAGGVESMTRAPYVMPKADKVYDRAPKVFDTTLGWRMTNREMPVEYTISMGDTAENVAEKYAIAREEQDAFALGSQQKTKLALERGAFADEIVPHPQL
ncbi:MAG: 3-oxoadipyl-CoA thiolase, partial [Candidatus Lustribacter sp.]